MYRYVNLFLQYTFKDYEFHSNPTFLESVVQRHELYIKKLIKNMKDSPQSMKRTVRIDK